MASSAIAEAISRVFAARDTAHRKHLRSISFAEHVALGEFYEGVIDKIDELVECYQGMFGLVEEEVKAPKADTSDMCKYLEAECEWLEENRSAISNGVEALSALVDNLSAIYLRTIFKLEHLK